MHVKKFVSRKIFVRDYKNYDKESFKYQIRNTPWENCLKHADVNSAWNCFKEYLTSVVNTHVVEK